MLRELLKTKRRFESQGFALPTVMIVSVVMMIILVTAVQASASVRTALSNQYYNNLAAEAAESGIMFANACTQKSDGYASWSQLQPNTNCSGEGFDGMRRYLIDNDDMRTTFSVSSTTLADDNFSDPYDLTVSGSVQLLRKSDRENPWKTVSVKKKLKVQPCTKTIKNLIQNPSFENNATSWNQGPLTERFTSTTGANQSITDGADTLQIFPTPSGSTSYNTYVETPVAMQSGKTYTVSGVVYRPNSTWNSNNENIRKLSITVIANTSGGFTEYRAQAPTTNPGYQRVSTTFTVPNNVTSSVLRLYNGIGGSSGSGSISMRSVYWDSISLTEGSRDYGYKDGDTKGWAWNGTFNNTTSAGPVRTACTSATTCNPTNLITNPNFESNLGTIPTGTAGANTWEANSATPAIQTPPIGQFKSNSLKITPTGTSGDSFASIGGDNGAIRLGMQPGKTYTVSATVYVPRKLEGTVYVPLRRAGIVIHTYTAGSGYVFYTATPNGTYKYYQAIETLNSPVTIEPGTYNLKVTFTMPETTTYAFLRLYNGGIASANESENSPVYWDNVALYEGTRAPYYDGQSSGWSWSGTPNLSTSTGPIIPCNATISY